MHSPVNPSWVEQRSAPYANSPSEGTGWQTWLHLNLGYKIRHTDAHRGTLLHHLVTIHRINTTTAASPEDGKSPDSLSCPVVGDSSACYPLQHSWQLLRIMEIGQNYTCRKCSLVHCNYELYVCCKFYIVKYPTFLLLGLCGLVMALLALC